MLDQAIYLPAAHTPAYIVGVRGGYIFQFDPVTLTLQNYARFCYPSFGDSAIGLVPGNEWLVASVWNEQTANNENDTRGLYLIDPLTLRVEFFVSSASLGGTLSQGFHNMASGGGEFYWSASPKLSYFDVPDLAGGCSAPLPYYPIWTDVAMDLVNGIPYSTDPINDVIYAYVLGATIPTVGFNPYGICVVPTNTFLSPETNHPLLFVTARTGTVYWYQIGVSSGWTGISLGAPYPTTPLPYRIRYNPVDGLVYVPDVQGNEVFVINPVTKTVVKVYPSPYTMPLDSPIDVVFTPANVFAVQQGINGLALIK